MNRDDIIRMAREAGLEEEWIIDPGSPERFERFFHMAQAAEREACEKIEEKLACSPAMFPTMGEYRAHRDAVISYQKAIRARGQQ